MSRSEGCTHIGKSRNVTMNGGTAGGPAFVVAQAHAAAVIH
jgi:hypothetical protein